MNKIELADQNHEKMIDAVQKYDRLESLPEMVQDQLAHLATDGRPNILALYYGGTLGMLPNEKGHLEATENYGELLRPLKEKGLDEKMNVVWFPVWKKAIDSTNGRWPHWVSIANGVRLLYDHFDGFVVAGGTDTMPHLLAALRLTFPNIGKPLITTGAQLPMVHIGDDATQNLAFALEAAKSDLSGVHLAFANTLRGALVHKVKDREFDAFTSAQRFVGGYFDGEVHLNPSAPRRNPLVTAKRLEFNPHFRDGIKVVQLSPLTSSEALIHEANNPHVHALLLTTHGAGNVRDEGIFDLETTDIDVIKRMHEKGFPVVLGSPMIDGKVDSPYKAGAAAVSEKVGGISAQDITGPALQVLMSRCLANSWGGPNVASSENRLGFQVQGMSMKSGLNYHRFRDEMNMKHYGDLYQR